MKLRAFLVDAFTKRVFGGNPAAVVLLESTLPDGVLLSVAKENAQPETAFILPLGDGSFNLRWFTPDMEMDLCGHATLASAHVLFSHQNYSGNIITFRTHSGVLSVRQSSESTYEMDFPLREASPATLPQEILDSLNIKPSEVYKARDYLLVYKRESDIANLVVEKAILDEINIDPGGVIVTAPGDSCDFVSRYFTPQATIMEDPVTGSAHCTLAPYWAAKLRKDSLSARQISERGGELLCKVEEERLIITGEAITYSESTIYLNI